MGGSHAHDPHARILADPGRRRRAHLLLESSYTLTSTVPELSLSGL